MKKISLKKPALTGLAVAILHFILFYVGVAVILKNPIGWQHLLANAVLSLIVGVIAFALCLPKIRLGLYIFLAGIAVGFAAMYTIFFDGATGWADLAGLMTYFMIGLIALVCAVTVILIVFIVRKLRNGKASDAPANDSPENQ